MKMKQTWLSLIYFIREFGFVRIMELYGNLTAYLMTALEWPKLLYTLILKPNTLQTIE